MTTEIQQPHAPVQLVERPVIAPRHVELLRKSAIPVPLAELAGVMSLCGAETWDLGFGEKTGPALAFPYRDPKTGAKLVGFLRLRLDHPNGTGRYRQTPGSRNHLYIPFAEPEALRDPSRPIILTEGERKALALTAWCERQGRPDVVIGIGGVWSWRRAIKGDLPDGSVGKIGSKPIEDLDLIVWTGRQVVIVFDSDVQQNVDVQRAERGLARELASRGAAVFSTRIPPGPHGVKVGADDLLAERDDTAMTEVLAAAQQAEPPEILIGPDIPRVVDEAEQALLAAGGIYSRGRVLVEVSHKRGRRHHRLALPAGVPALLPVDEARLRELTAESARWTVVKKDENKPSMPPFWVAKTLMSRPSWSFLEIAMVSETPMFRPDGSIIESPGYDEMTGVLLAMREAFPSVPDAPTLDDAKTALKQLSEPFADFPFATESDRSATFAAILSLIARPAVPGPIPLYIVDAPAQGAGKTLLADVIACIGTGHSAPKTTAPADEAETRKRLLAVAIEALPVVVLDNLTGTLRSATLSAALTATEWCDRLLGHNRTVTAPLTTIWMATGNNCSFGSDIARRVIPIRLDPKVEHPEERTGFKHADLRAHVLTDRPWLVAAALTFLRAYHVAGRPAHDKPPMGSFESWDALIRGALLWAGEPDPLEGRARVRAHGDLEGEALRVALNVWSETIGSEPVTAADAVDQAKSRPELQTALAELAGIEVGKLSGKCVGYALRKVAGRIVGARSFERDDKKTHGATWWTVVEHRG